MLKVRGQSESASSDELVRLVLWVSGGAEGDRTPDLRIANAALSQLSYDPERRRRVMGRSCLSTGRDAIGAPLFSEGNASKGSSRKVAGEKGERGLTVRLG